MPLYVDSLHRQTPHRLGPHKASDTPPSVQKAILIEVKRLKELLQKPFPALEAVNRFNELKHCRHPCMLNSLLVHLGGTEIYFIKRVDKGRMATVKDLESWRFER